MTDPVKGISSAQKTSAGGSYSGGNLSGGHKRQGPAHPQNEDLIEISLDARERLRGTTRRGLLAYLKGLFR